MRILRRRAGKQLILGAIIGVVVIGGVLGGVMVGRKMGGKANAAEAAKEAKAEGEAADEKSEGEEGDKAEAKGEKGHGKGEEGEAHPQVVDLGEFLVNLRAGSAVHYLQAQVALSLSGLPEPKKGGHGEGGKGAPSLPEAELAVVKDRVVTVLSGADFDQVRTTPGRQAVKQQLLISLAKALPNYKVNEVLFTSFVTQ